MANNDIAGSTVQSPSFQTGPEQAKVGKRRALVASDQVSMISERNDRTSQMSRTSKRSVVFQRKNDLTGKSSNRASVDTAFGHGATFPVASPPDLEELPPSPLNDGLGLNEIKGGKEAASAAVPKEKKSISTKADPNYRSISNAGRNAGLE